MPKITSTQQIVEAKREPQHRNPKMPDVIFRDLEDNRKLLLHMHGRERGRIRVQAHLITVGIIETIRENRPVQQKVGQMAALARHRDLEEIHLR